MAKLRVFPFHVGPLDNNVYLVVDEAAGCAAIVDPSFDSRGVQEVVAKNGWRLVWVLNTHAHFDHVIENAFFMEESGAPLALHPDDLPLLRALPQQAAWFGLEAPAPSEPTHFLSDSESIPIGGGSLKVLHTPGHSPGGVSFVGEGFVIVGDALFAGSIGRTDLPGGDMNQLLQSIRTRLLSLPDDTRVYPGHGPETTIGRERETNPYL